MFVSYLGKSGIALSVAVIACLAYQKAHNSPASHNAQHPTSTAAHRANAVTPLRFEPNQGQHAKAVQFLARGSGYTLALSGKSALFSFTNRDAKGLQRSKTHKPTETAFSMQFANALPSSVAQGEEPLPGVINYCKGEDRAQWRLGVRPLRKVRYKNLYEGVDALFYGNPRQLEYDFIVAPNADPKRIQLRFSGLKNLHVTKSGDLELQTTGRTAFWRRPVAYQNLASGRKAVTADYRLGSDGTLSFEIGSYDRAASLVIDPVFTYSSFLGGNGEDGARSIAVDGSGSSYVTGYTNSPVMTGVTNPKKGYAGEYDAFVTKIKANGDHDYTTYWGGGGDDLANAITLDGASPANVFITGSTNSQDVTSIPPVSDTLLFHAFVAKLNTDGLPINAWQFGGSDGEEGLGIAYRDVTVNGVQSENLYIVGYTNSGDFPMKLAWQSTSKGGGEGFLACYNITNNTATLTHSTYIGNTGDDVATCVAVEASGNKYVVVGGHTNSAKFYTTRNAAQRTPKGGYDGFVIRFSQTATTMNPKSATLLGGQADDYLFDLAVDNNNVVYATGKTYSDDFPMSADALQPYLSGWADAFVTGINPDSSVLYSTLLGGEEEDSAQGIALINSALGTPPTVFLTGYTYSGYDLSYPFPTVAAEQVWGGGYDAFLTILSPTRNIQESTLLGGSLDDVGLSVAVYPTPTTNRPGEWWIAGTTLSDDLTTSENALSGTFSVEGSTEAFVARYVPAPRLASASLSSPRITVGGSASVTATLDVIPPKPMDIRYTITDADGILYRDLTVPASLTSTATTFKLDLPSVQQTSDLTVTISFLSDSQDLTLRLVAPRLKSRSFDKAVTVFSGQSLGVTVTLDRTVEVDTNVLLSLNKAGAKAPASVIVKRGKDSARFVVTTKSSVDVAPILKMQLGTSILTAELRVLVPRTVTLSLDKSSIKGGAIDDTGKARLTAIISPVAPNWAKGLQVTFAATVDQGGSVVTFTPVSATIAPGTSTITVDVQATTTTANANADLEASLYSKVGAITLSITK